MTDCNRIRQSQTDPKKVFLGHIDNPADDWSVKFLDCGDILDYPKRTKRLTAEMFPPSVTQPDVQSDVPVNANEHCVGTESDQA